MRHPRRRRPDRARRPSRRPRSRARVTPTRTATPTATPTPTHAATPTRTATPDADAHADADCDRRRASRHGAGDQRRAARSSARRSRRGDVAEGCAESTSGVDLLRFSAASKNVGTADLVLGDPQCPSPCIDHPLEVCGNPDFVCSPAAGHNHPHYSNYARYELLDASGSVVVVGHKQGYCLRDTNCAAPVYTCANQGISAGCSDVYGSSLGCQYLDVTGIPAGNYVLRVTIDPLNQIAELSDANNVTQQAVTITRPGDGDADPHSDRDAGRRDARPRSAPRRRPAPRRRHAPPTATPTATPVPTRTAPRRRQRPPCRRRPRPRRSAYRDRDRPTPRRRRRCRTRAAERDPDAAVDPNGAVAAACQRAILKAGRTLVDRGRSPVSTIARRRSSSCEAPRRRTAGCRERATASCAQGLGELAAARAAFVESGGRALWRCRRRGAPRGRRARLRAAARMRVRDEFGGGLGDVAAVASCVASQHGCRSGGARRNRGSARRRASRDGRSVRAPSSASPISAAPIPNAPENPDARALDACSRAVRRAGRRFATHRLAHLQSCLAAHASCLKHDVRPRGVRASAPTRPAPRARRASPAMPARLAATIERGCGGLDFDARARRGRCQPRRLWRRRCAALGVPALASLADYEQCLARQHACAVDDAAALRGAARRRMDRRLAGARRRLSRRVADAICDGPLARRRARRII